MNAAIAELKSVADKAIERSMNLAAEVAVLQALNAQLTKEVNEKPQAPSKKRA